MSRATVEDGWLEVGDSSLAVTWYRPGAASAGHRVGTVPTAVLAVGIGMDDRVEALGVPAVAEGLLARGIPTLVVHPSGSGQSAGTLQDPSTVGRWTADVRAAVAHAAGVGRPGSSVVLIALRSAALGVVTAPLPADVGAVALWQPVLDGRRYARELSLLSTAGTESGAPPRLGAFALSESFLRRLGECSVRSTTTRLSAPVLLLADAAPADERSIAHLRELAPSLELASAPDTATWLGVSSELARTPLHSVDQLIAWVAAWEAGKVTSQAVPADAPPTPPAAEAPTPLMGTTRRVVHEGIVVRESLVEVGSVRMSGVLTEPDDAEDGRSTAVLLLSSTGPGRSFVELARQLAAGGHVSLRIDLSSFGSSARHRRQGRGELYAHGAPDDVRESVRWLNERGHQDVTLVGFCATAWLAVRAAGDSGVAAVVAINAPLYAPGPPWRTIDGVHGPLGWRLIDRTGRAGRVERMREMVRRRFLPAPGVRHLMRASAAGTRVMLAFDSQDVGLTHLRTRIGGLELPGVDVSAYDELGHALDGLTARRRLYADMVGWVSV